MFFSRLRKNWRHKFSKSAEARGSPQLEESKDATREIEGASSATDAFAEGECTSVQSLGDTGATDGRNPQLPLFDTKDLMTELIARYATELKSAEMYYWNEDPSYLEDGILALEYVSKAKVEVDTENEQNSKGPIGADNTSLNETLTRVVSEDTSPHSIASMSDVDSTVNDPTMSSRTLVPSPIDAKLTRAEVQLVDEDAVITEQPAFHYRSHCLPESQRELERARSSTVNLETDSMALTAIDSHDTSEVSEIATREASEEDGSTLPTAQPRTQKDVVKYAPMFNLQAATHKFLASFQENAGAYVQMELSRYNDLRLFAPKPVRRAQEGPKDFMERALPMIMTYNISFGKAVESTRRLREILLRELTVLVEHQTSPPSSNNAQNRFMDALRQNQRTDDKMRDSVDKLYNSLCDICTENGKARRMRSQYRRAERQISAFFKKHGDVNSEIRQSVNAEVMEFRSLLEAAR